LARANDAAAHYTAGINRLLDAGGANEPLDPLVRNQHTPLISHISTAAWLKVKGLDIYTPPLTEQQRFTMRSGALTSISSR